MGLQIVGITPKKPPKSAPINDGIRQSMMRLIRCHGKRIWQAGKINGLEDSRLAESVAIEEYEKLIAIEAEKAYRRGLADANRFRPLPPGAAKAA